MFFVTESNRILADEKFLNNEKYIAVDDYPVVPYIEGKIGYVCGIDTENNKVLFKYEDICVLPDPESQEITKDDITKIQSTVDYLAMMAE